jgi:hypothetical protein
MSQLVCRIRQSPQLPHHSVRHDSCTEPTCNSTVRQEFLSPPISKISSPTLFASSVLSLTWYETCDNTSGTKIDMESRACLSTFPFLPLYDARTLCVCLSPTPCLPFRSCNVVPWKVFCRVFLRQNPSRKPFQIFKLGFFICILVILAFRISISGNTLKLSV